MKFTTITRIFLCVLLFSSVVVIASPLSMNAYAQTNVFLKSISRIPGGSVFSSPMGITHDSAGNIYVADSANFRVAKFSNTGTFVSSFGTAGQGELNTTSGVAVDASGNVYAVDSDHNQLTEFTSAGVFVKSFGNATLVTPSDAVVDSTGNIYVADTGNNQVAEFTSAGTLVKSFGSSTLLSPSGIAIGASGQVFVTDNGNSTVAEFDSSGTLVKSYGSGILSSPAGVDVDASGNVFVADNGNGTVAEFDSSGTLVKSYGSGTLIAPSGVIVDTSGNVFVSDTGGNQIVEFDSNGGKVLSFGTSESLLLSLPSNVALNSNGDIFVADQGNNRILVFDNTGKFLFSFGSHGNANGQFNRPFGISFDASGDIYVVDTGNNRVEKFDNTGAFLSSIGGVGIFNQPLGIAVGNLGNIYITDTNNKRVAEFTSSGTFIKSFGVGTLTKPSGVVFNAADNFYVSDRVNNLVYEFNQTTGSIVNKFPNINSTGIALNIPYGIGFDFPGNLHIVDSGNSRIVVLSGTGKTVTTFGSAGAGAGQFATPSGLAIDASGNIYVADTANNRVEIFSPTVPPVTSITLNNPNPSSVRWGIDSVSISGHATSVPSGGTVTVNWGDGSNTTNIPVSVFTGNWGPAIHIYPSTESGKTESVVGTIHSGNTVVATSSPVSVSVKAHHTSITIGNIVSLPFGGRITASGILTDTDASVGVPSVSVSFSGTGIGIVPPATTAASGSYSSVGTAVNFVLNGLAINANFAGNSQYLPSSATTQTFSTSPHHVALFLKPITDTPWGGAITIAGTLNDTDGGNIGINGKSITILGNGVSSSQTVTTSTISGHAGSFSATSTSPSNVESGLSVTANFAGTLNYTGTSTTVTFNTIAHHTSLTLNTISNIIIGGTITASGKLTDTDANVGLVGSAITFNGTGVGTITSISTGSEGSYSSQGTAPNSLLSGLTLQAHYGGGPLYQKSDSITQTYSTGSAPSVSINPPGIPNTLGGNQARWGVDPVTINGTASNIASGDTITVTWGDSVSSTNVIVNSGKWGPLTHTYGAGAVGTNHVIASLISNTNINRASAAPLSIFVLQHKASLTLNSISNMSVGGPFTVSGRLTDADVNVGISSQPIVFNGTGAGTLVTTSTNSSGYYTATGTASNSPVNGLKVQARFTGDLDTFAASSNVQAYNVLPITTPPEGFNQFDPVSKDVIVYGVDANGNVFGPIKAQSITPTIWNPEDDKGGDHSKSGDQNGDKSVGDEQKDGDHQYNPVKEHDMDGKSAELRTFDIVDSGGHSEVLVEKVIKSHNQVNVHVISMQYDNGPVMLAPVNLKHFSWSIDKNSNLRELDQVMIVGKFELPTIFVHAEFSQEKNQTHLEVHQFGQHPLILTKAGLDLIKMLTLKGSLLIQY